MQIRGGSFTPALDGPWISWADHQRTLESEQEEYEILLAERDQELLRLRRIVARNYGQEKRNSK